MKPRGYAGDAELIDYYYDRHVPAGISPLGAQLFGTTIRFPTGRAIDFRRAYARERLEGAWAAGKEICALACGHLREADGMVGRNLSNLVVVDQDAASLGAVANRHGSNVNFVEANVISYLRKSASEGVKFDFIYTLGLTDYFSDRAMVLFYRLMKRCLRPGGEILVANFLQDHIARGWMEAVMDWHLIYRTDADMQRHASGIGLSARTWHDPTGSIVLCEMRDD